ncbi:hypothetical protein [Shewanella psychropiezotolerans]|uniref:hypothetical protein n=1 Tax=Shewanella psychropiezotolerans TaxID=2593655 RepID=UPI00163D7881|nr:hypothetical protein [Shewanella psychropiezotolerans]
MRLKLVWLELAPDKLTLRLVSLALEMDFKSKPKLTSDTKSDDTRLKSTIFDEWSVVALSEPKLALDGLLRTETFVGEMGVEGAALNLVPGTEPSAELADGDIGVVLCPTGTSGENLTPNMTTTPLG